MGYVLESGDEAARLEQQSGLDAYDYRRELSGIAFERTELRQGLIVDAGCGSGIVSRYLARENPTFKILGLDGSNLRIAQARELAKSVGLKGDSNLYFKECSLLDTGLESGSVDGIVCRYVMQHLAWEDRPRVLQEFKRILRPGGKLVVIDVDGFFYNLQPQTPLIAEVFAKLRACERFDFSVGGKLPHEMAVAGFKKVTWKIETMDFQGKALEQEIEQYRARFAQVAPMLAPLVGGAEVFERFVEEFIDSCSADVASLYYSKFLLTANS